MRWRRKRVADVLHGHPGGAMLAPARNAEVFPVPFVIPRFPGPSPTRPSSPPSWAFALSRKRPVSDDPSRLRGAGRCLVTKRTTKTKKAASTDPRTTPEIATDLIACVRGMLEKIVASDDPKALARAFLAEFKSSRWKFEDQPRRRR